MAIFENFPYTNFHEMNLDYILKRVKELEGEVADLTALLESGPVVDVKAKVNGAYTSIKDADGNVDLPVADHNHVGGLLYDSSTFNEANMIGLKGNDGWEKIPTLDGNDQIDPAYLPPTVDVLMNDNGVWTSVVDGNGDAKIAKATPTLFGTVKVESSNDLSARKMKIYADGQYDALPTLDVNDQIDASAIPDTTVTAGTYGPDADGSNFTPEINIPQLIIGSDGRISSAYNRPYPRLYQLRTTIAAGSLIGSLYFNNSYAPDNNHVYWAAPFVYTYESNGMGGYTGTPLYEGVDYTWTWSESGTVSVRLNNTNASTVYVIVYGYLARSSK